MENNTNPKSRARKKGVRIFFNVVFAIFIIAAISFFFDGNPYNVHLGWLTLLGFWFIRSLDQTWIDLGDNRKRSALFHFLLAVVALTALIVRGTQYLI